MEGTNILYIKFTTLLQTAPVAVGASGKGSTHLLGKSLRNRVFLRFPREVQLKFLIFSRESVWKLSISSKSYEMAGTGVGKSQTSKHTPGICIIGM